MSVQASDPIEVWYWPTPNGFKITIALEEMGLPYEIRPVNIGKGEQFSPEFLAISPNGRMPAVIDPDGPGGQPIAVFESGAILQYLGRKSGLFYPTDERARTEVEQWLFWQVGGLGPMAGQTHHFRQYAPHLTADQRHLAYGANRYTNEVHRLYGVLDARLKERDFVAGDYSIADMAIWPWVTPFRAQGQDLNEFPALKAWYERVGARPAVQVGAAVGKELRSNLAQAGKEADAARAVLFGQRARR
jgi:glutathione S-transferase/GST-like protein